MPVDLRPRRSVLYMPSSNARALEKARTLPADGLIFDLEDGVAAEAKEAARMTIAAALAGGYGERELLLRVNSLETPWGADDLAFASRLPIHGVVLPKVEGAETVLRAAAILEASGAPETLGIWCMIETPRGVLRTEAIAAAHARLAGLIMGSNDLVNDLHARHTPDRLPLLTSMGLCVLAARAYGLAILDGVHRDLDDDEGFALSCSQGLAWGFDGKTLIHPKTIAAANAVFAPGATELETARRTIAGFNAAAAEGKAVARVDGKLVEALHVRNAERLVDLADRIARLEGAAGEIKQTDHDGKTPSP